jgi:AraC-like DNA-binding protein
VNWPPRTLAGGGRIAAPGINIALREDANCLLAEPGLPVAAWHINLGGLGETFKQTGRPGADGLFFVHSATLIPPGLPVTWRIGHTLRRIVLEFDEPRLIAADERHDLRESPPRYDPAIEHLLGLLAQEWSESQRPDSAFLAVFGSMLTLHARRRYRVEDSASPTSDDAAFAHIRRYVDDHLTEPLTVDSIASALGLSQQSISLIVKLHERMTPYQYVIHRRLRMAERMLAGTDTPLADIALSCGFSSQSHLTSVFGKTKGITPKAYRNQHMGASPTASPGKP